MPPDRASMMPLGVIAMSGLRSLPEENSVENEPATGATTNVISEIVLEGMSRVATGVLSLRRAVMATAESAETDCVLGIAFEDQFGIVGQDDAA